MRKKQTIMEINGKRYDVHTGAALDRHHPPAKPITVHHVGSQPAAESKPSNHDQPRRHAVRQPARHAAHHKPQRSTTLMRRTVRRPSDSLKRRVKAQGHTGSLIENPEAPVIHSPLFSSPDSKRLHHAEHIKRSRLIMHFNPRQPAYQSGFKVPVTINQPAKRSAAPQAKSKTVPRQGAPDIDEIFDRAIQNATSHLEPAPKKARKRRLHLTRRHARA